MPQGPGLSMPIAWAPTGQRPAPAAKCRKQPGKPRKPRPMPDRATLEAFIAAVESNDHVGAIRDFYTEDASMQENLAEPRRGRQLLMDHEAAVLSRVAAVRSRCVRPVLVEEIGRAHVRTPVTNAHLVCRLLLE